MQIHSPGYKNVCAINTLIFLFFLRVELPRVMTRIGLNTFTLEDIHYFKEYVLVMTRVAHTLDKLQAGQVRLYASSCGSHHNELESHPG